MKRTLALETVEQVGTVVYLQGWVHAYRDMGKVSFIDFRDRSGVLQVVCVPSQLGETAKNVLQDIRVESCVAVTGLVQKRQEQQINPSLATGGVEILAQDLVVLNPSKPLPFSLDDTAKVHEELRLKYRYLDLRSDRMHRNVILRDRVAGFFRDFLHRHDFVEIETPYLTKGTPEGSREFLVPSRLHAGKFYVLPQSPQQFKQLMMVAGFERYFQMARCFRDEDQRGDRQPEHTQFDLEMSFVDREDVIDLFEQLLIELIKTVTPEKRIQHIPFPKISYQEAMEKYGTDKPDLRDDKHDPNLLAFAWVVDFPFFEKTDDGAWTYSHNPFSAPKPEHLDWLMRKERIGEILTTQYDIVLNGYEIGGGSIRNHQPEPLEKVFEILGHSTDQIQEKFGHILEALAFGAPPHGGLGPGLDRLVMILANEPNIREVIAVPKTGDARDLLMGAPSDIEPQRLQEAHIMVRLPEKNHA